MAPRAIEIRAPDGSTLWQGNVSAGQLTRVPHLDFDLPRGRSALTICTDHPGTPASASDPRILAFAVYDFTWANAHSDELASVPAADLQTDFPAEHWYPAERAGADSWRWANDSANISIRNRGPAARFIISFALASFGPDRSVTICDPAGNSCWKGRVTMKDRRPVEFECLIPTGESKLSVLVDTPPISPGGADGRSLTVAIYNFAMLPGAGK